jgi:hypothetical protein
MMEFSQRPLSSNQRASTLSTFNAENKLMFKACSMNKNDCLNKQVYSLRDGKARTPSITCAHKNTQTRLSVANVLN